MILWLPVTRNLPGLLISCMICLRGKIKAHQPAPLQLVSFLSYASHFSGKHWVQAGVGSTGWAYSCLSPRSWKMLEKHGSFANKCKSKSPIQMWETAEGKAKVYPLAGPSLPGKVTWASRCREASEWGSPSAVDSTGTSSSGSRNVWAALHKFLGYSGPSPSDSSSSFSHPCQPSDHPLPK